LKPGFFADITIFDSVTIIDHATYTKPDQLSTGVDYVIVNGQLEYEGGKLTGITAGRTLSRSRVSAIRPLTVFLGKSFLLTHKRGSGRIVADPETDRLPVAGQSPSGPSSTICDVWP